MMESGFSRLSENYQRLTRPRPTTEAGMSMAQTVFHRFCQRIAIVAMCGLALLMLLHPSVATAKSCPNLVIVIDQSASMAKNAMGITVPQGSPDSKPGNGTD